MPAPIPETPPVTIAVRPSNRPAMSCPFCLCAYQGGLGAVGQGGHLGPQGHSVLCPEPGADRGEAVFGEASGALAELTARPPNQRERAVVERGKDMVPRIWRRHGSRPRTVRRSSCLAGWHAGGGGYGAFAPTARTVGLAPDPNH